MLRNIIERWSRGIILKRRLPKEFGQRTIFVSPEGGGLRYFKFNLDSIDPMLLNVVRVFIQPNDVIWDIGGNVGFFALTSAVQTKGGQVGVFEPDISLANLLRKTADANPDLKIDIFPFAVSDKVGVARFNIAVRSRSTNYLDQSQGSTQTGGVRRSFNVPTIALDAVLDWYPAPKFVKIDTEGAEVLVLKGMQKILSTVRPVILCEVSGENREEVCAIFVKNNYQLLDAEALPVKKSFSDPSQNILAIPK